MVFETMMLTALLSIASNSETTTPPSSSASAGQVLAAVAQLTPAHAANSGLSAEQCASLQGAIDTLANDERGAAMMQSVGNWMNARHAMMLAARQWRAKPASTNARNALRDATIAEREAKQAMDAAREALEKAALGDAEASVFAKLHKVQALSGYPLRDGLLAGAESPHNARALALAQSAEARAIKANKSVPPAAAAVLATARGKSEVIAAKATLETLASSSSAGNAVP